MQPVQIFSAPAAASPADPAACGAAPVQTPATDPFDALMGRALARSSPEKSDGSESSDEPARDKDKPRTARHSGSATSARPDQVAAAGNVASSPAPPPPPPARTATSKPSTSTTPPAEAVEDKRAGIAGSKPDTGSSAAAATPSNSRADVLASAAPAATVEPAAEGTPGRTLPETAEAALRNAAVGEGVRIHPHARGDQPAGAADDKAASPGISGNQDGAGGGVRAGPATAPGVAGISGAQQDSPMQKAEKMNEFTGSLEQKLPARVAGGAGEELPGRAAPIAGSLSHQGKSELSVTPGSAATGAASPADTASAATTSAAWPSMSPMRTLERAHDLMSLHAFRLRDSGADSLQVVIKPGPGLHLSLDLQMRDGGVEMRAVLHRGDFDFMNRHWSDLREQLEQRGVRLAPLACEGQAAGGGDNLYQQPGRRPTDEETTAGTGIPEFALAGALTPAAAVKAKAPRGWETWA